MRVSSGSAVGATSSPAPMPAGLQTAPTPPPRRLRKHPAPRKQWKKQFNKVIASLRAPVEHCISHLKNWKILSKVYRGRLEEIPAIIPIATQLELLRTL